MLYTVKLKKFVFCCSCVTGPKGSAAACVCVAGYEGNGTYCKGKKKKKNTHTPSLISNVITICLFVSQSWICAADPTVDVQSLQSVRRFQPEKGRVRVKKGTLETGLSAWVCSPDFWPLHRTNNVSLLKSSQYIEPCSHINVPKYVVNKIQDKNNNILELDKKTELSFIFMYPVQRICSACVSKKTQSRVLWNFYTGSVTKNKEKQLFQQMLSSLIKLNFQPGVFAEIDGCLVNNGGCHKSADCIRTGPNTVRQHNAAVKCQISWVQNVYVNHCCSETKFIFGQVRLGQVVSFRKVSF